LSKIVFFNVETSQNIINGFFHHSSSSPIQSLLCPDRKQDIVKTISKP
jgi:hypothetical protein